MADVREEVVLYKGGNVCLGVCLAVERWLAESLGGSGGTERGDGRHL